MVQANECALGMVQATSLSSFGVWYSLLVVFLSLRGVRMGDCIIWEFLKDLRINYFRVKKKFKNKLKV